MPACPLDRGPTLANGDPRVAEKRPGMTFGELLAAIDERLAAEPRLADAHREEDGVEHSTWTSNRESVSIGPSGTTGIVVHYRSDGRAVHSKIFALSPMSVDRIVTSAAEHLTRYAYHRTSS
jgi:hypothetical protein